MLPARKLWIAFAIGARGVVTVDDGARTALCEGGRSLLPAGVVSVTGRFVADDAVELAGPLSIHHVHNSGIAFGLFSSATSIVIALTAVAVICLVLFFARSGRRAALQPG